MSVSSMIVAGRARVADTLIDTCTIAVPSDGAPTIDATTLVLTPAAPATIYAGECRVKKLVSLEERAVFGDVNVSIQRRLINLPYSAPAVPIDAMLTVTDSLDAEVLRRPMRVRVAVATSTLMFRRIGVEVVE